MLSERGFERLRAVNHIDGLRVLSHDGEMLGQPLVGRGVTGVEADGGLEGMLRSRPIPVVILQNERQRTVGFGERVVQFERTRRVSFRQRHNLVRRARGIAPRARAPFQTGLEGMNRRSIFFYFEMPSPP